MTPHTPALYYDPRRQRPDLPRAAIVLRATDKPGHVHLAVFSDPEFDIGRLPVEQARYVPWRTPFDGQPTVEIAYAMPAEYAHPLLIDARKGLADLEAIVAGIIRSLSPPCPPPPPPGRMPTS